MALPQRNDDFRDEEARLRAIDRRDAEIEARRDGGFGWIWLWWLFFIVIIFGWFAGWGWGGYGGWWGWGAPRAGIVQPMNGATVTNPILNATDRQAFVGKTLSVTNTQVLHKVNDTTFWVGPRDEQSLLVILSGNNNSLANAGISEGDHINVTGTVDKAPTAQEAQNQWKLDGDSAKRMEQQGVYLLANQVEKINNNQ